MHTCGPLFMVFGNLETESPLERQNLAVLADVYLLGSITIVNDAPRKESPLIAIGRMARLSRARGVRRS